MRFSEIVCFDAVIARLKATDRDGSIRELVNALGRQGKIPKASCQKIARAVIKRENEASTGIGRGVAVPHVKCSDVKEPVAVIGCSAEGVNFVSLDKQPVYSIILLLSSADNPDKHLQAMENIFRNLQKEDFRRFLRQAQTVSDIREIILDADGDTDQ